MRRILPLLIAALILVGVPVSGVAAADTPQPKVVVVLGPAGSATSRWKADADAAAAEARKFTTNVVTVYTPNATWAAVRTALQDAWIVVYIGHGNGYPSPYRKELYTLSQDGMGLNPVAGGDNSTVKWWGEYYLARDVRLAPGAVVVLNHLCYASGNSEPGLAEPTRSVAQQRVDNYAAGFLRAGAKAVIADAYYNPSYYINRLFTTTASVERIWRSSPNFHGNVVTFPSVRTQGMSGLMDMDTPTGGYHRSLVTRLDVRGKALIVRVPSADVSTSVPRLAVASPSALGGALGLDAMAVAVTGTSSRWSVGIGR